MRNEAEYEWCFRSSFASVARTVFLIVHDRGRAEELTQEAFLQLARKWRTVSEYERPDAWVRRVAIRMAVHAVQRESRRPGKERLAVVDAADRTLPDPDVQRAVASLAPMQRACVVLFYWEDRSVKEIAHVLQVSESTVKQHLFRARARLAGMLGEEVDSDAR